MQTLKRKKLNRCNKSKKIKQIAQKNKYKFHKINNKCVKDLLIIQINYLKNILIWSNKKVKLI